MPFIKNRVLIATLWSFLQRTGSLIIGFIANMVLARLLDPEDFGCIAIILVFTTFADILIDSGLNGALIQKKNVTKQDVSTVFTFNLSISITLFILFFFAAPYIERFVDIPNLTIYLRVESIALLIRAFYCIQAAFLSKNLKFKNLAKYNITSSAVSVSVAIVMAALGCGVWSLVAKNVVLQLSLCLLYRHASKVPYRLGFSKESFKELFGFGWFVAMTAFLDVLYSNLTSFLVGKRYSVKDLGYYNQAYSLQQIPVYSLSMVVTNVLFPFMSKMQDDGSRVLYNTRRVFKVSTLFVFPLMVYLIFFAKPVIVFIFSSKWEPSAVYFQILCFGGMVNALIHICRNVLKSIGETKSLFLSQIVITSIAIAGMMFFLRFELKWLVVWVSACSYINWIVIGFITGKKIGYNIFLQLKDIALNIVFSLIAGVLSYLLFGNLISNVIVVTFVSASFFAVVYFLLHFMFKTDSFNTLLSSVK